MSKLYTVYDNKTDLPIIVDGTAKECAAAMGVKLATFRTTLHFIKRGRRCRWYIELTRVDEDYPQAITFGSKLRHHRVEQGMSIKELSMFSGITTSTISNIEHGNYSPTLHTAKCLAEVLHLSLDYLAGIEGGDKRH